MGEDEDGEHEKDGVDVFMQCEYAGEILTKISPIKRAKKKVATFVSFHISTIIHIAFCFSFITLVNIIFNVAILQFFWSYFCGVALYMYVGVCFAICHK